MSLFQPADIHRPRTRPKRWTPKWTRRAALDAVRQTAELYGGRMPSSHEMKRSPRCPNSRTLYRLGFRSLYDIAKILGLPTKPNASWLKRKYCQHGHQRTPENLYKSGACRPCTLRRMRERHRVAFDTTHIRKTHCKRGHPRTSETVGWNGGCRICNIERGRARYRLERLNALRSRGDRRQAA